MKGVMVGCGYFGGIHLDGWSRLRDEVTIEAVCDVDRDLAQRRAAQYGGARAYTDFEAMLDAEKPDFADIVTRPALHEVMVRRTADRGIAVLCQKPLAPDYAGAERIVAYCRERGVRFMANENWRWQAWYRELKKLIDSGVVGQPFYFTLRHRTNDGAGDSPYPRQPYFVSMPQLLLVETMIHFIDTARFLVGDLDLVRCDFRRVNPTILGEDVVLMVLEGAGGLLGVIDGNRLSQPEHEGAVMGDARIEGEGGTLSLLGDGRIWIRPLDGPSREHAYPIPTTGYRGDSVYQTLRHFVECMRSGAEFESNGEDYLKTTRIVFEGYRIAHRRGMPLRSIPRRSSVP